MTAKTGVTFVAMHEGKKLREFLERRGINFSRLPKALGYSRSATTRWFESEKFSPRVWRSVKTALERIDTDPRMIRPDDEGADEDIPALRDLVKKTFDARHIPALREILEAPDSARKNLLRHIISMLDALELKK